MAGDGNALRPRECAARVTSTHFVFPLCEQLIADFQRRVRDALVAG